MSAHHCSIIGCRRSTLFPFKKNPRERWIIGLELHNETDETLPEKVKLNLCPQHAAEALKLDEEFYQRTERTEQFVREHATMN